MSAGCRCWSRCEACDTGMRRANWLHYDDANGGWTWGICRFYVNQFCAAWTHTGRAAAGDEKA